MRLSGKPLDANKKYKVAGWAPVAEGAPGEPIWEVVTKWLRDKKTVAHAQAELAASDRRHRQPRHGLILGASAVGRWRAIAVIASAEFRAASARG